MVLLKIEIFPAPSDKSNINETGATPSLTPSETHYASLSCSASKLGESGRLWSLGRKQGDACIGADRSVSREHVILSVATANKTLLLDPASSGDNGNQPAPCTTPAQVEACKEDADQMCILLQNVGKLGSFLVVEEPMGFPEKEHKNAKDNEDDDSATANSEEVSQSQNIAATVDMPLSFVAQHFTQNKQTKVKLRPIALNETVVLTELSHNIDKDTQTTNHNNLKRVIVQCGKLGTTIIITRLHIQLVACTDAKRHAALRRLLPWATGCTVVDDLPSFSQSFDSSFPHTNYLIAREHKAGTRNLEAWSRGIPLVSPDFVTEVVERSSPSAPWPMAAQYPPASDGNTFWTQIKPDPRLWSTYTLLVYHDNGGNDVERLVLAAGAMHVDLVHPSTGNGVTTTTATRWDDPECLREIVQHHSNCVAVLDARKSSQKIVQLLQNQLGVPMVTAKQVARDLVAQSALLHDTNGNEIGIGDVDDAFPAKQNADTSTSHHHSSASVEEGKSADTTHGDDDSSNSNKSSRDRTARGLAAMKTKNGSIFVPTDDRMVESEEANKSPRWTKESTSTNTSLRVAQTKRKASDDSENDNKEEPPPTLHKSKKSKGVEPEYTDVSMNENALKSLVVDKPLNIQEPQPPLEVSSENREPLPREGPRQELATSQSIHGWLTALPQGQKRRQYQRSAAEIKDSKGWETVREACPTDRVKGLVMAPKQNQPENVAPTKEPNFKAFCKNQVPKPRDPTVVRMTSVLPRENPTQRDLEEQQQVIAEHQRVADELFRDGGRASRRR